MGCPDGSDGGTMQPNDAGYHVRSVSQRLSRSPRRRRSHCRRVLQALGLVCSSAFLYSQWGRDLPWPRASRAPSIEFGLNRHGLSIARLEEDLQTCQTLHRQPADPAGLGRERNARYVDGHRPTLIRNATVWTGEPVGEAAPDHMWTGQGYSWISADVYLEFGLIKQVAANIHIDSLPVAGHDLLIYNARGRPLTSGVIDLHSHAGVHSLPTLHGNEDTSELSTDVTPYVRTVDGIQPLDRHLQIIKSGGVTTSLVLPGSSNNIGGEAYVIKHAVGPADGRNETSVTDMLADPGRTWRYLKMACGENAKQVHGRAGERGPTSRLGESWELRHAFEQAARRRQEQDDWCAAASHDLAGIKTYLPNEIEWEALVALLRGQAHLNIHCYTIPDLEAFVDHSNEFQFPIKAFHHAHQAYLVPEVLQRTWGGPPALALFADNMWYKAEAAVGSPHAGKRLFENKLVPIYVSDNPIMNAQHLVFEAAKAYRHGLPYHAALASVTTAPAAHLGLGQRLGKLKAGFDADVVVWDSDPLSVGATPVQVWIDGTAQFANPVELEKAFDGPIGPNVDSGRLSEDTDDSREASFVGGNIVFTGVTESLVRVDETSVYDKDAPDGQETFNMAVSAGRITCIGRCQAYLDAAAQDGSTTVIALKNGYVTPSFTAIGGTLGLSAIDGEAATENGPSSVFSRAVDGLALDTEKLRVALRSGVTHAISAPQSDGLKTHHGTSAVFRTGATTAVESDAVPVQDVALHYTLARSSSGHGHGVGNIASMSVAVRELRDTLLAEIASPGNPYRAYRPYTESDFLRQVVTGTLPLVVTVHSADTIAALLRVKKTVDEAIASAFAWTSNNGPRTLRMVLLGGAEAHLVADALAAAHVGVILSPMQPFALSWDQRRCLSGAPLTNGTGLDILLQAGVATAVGVDEDWMVRGLGLLAGSAHRNGGGRISARQAFDLVGKGIYDVLGAESPAEASHFVVHEGNPLEIASSIKAVSDGRGKMLVL